MIELFLIDVYHLFSDPERIGVLLTNSIFEAHTRTSLLSKEQIQEHWKTGIDQTKLYAFKNMVIKLLIVTLNLLTHLSLLTAVPGGTVASGSSKADQHYHANHRVRQDGTWFHEIPSG